MSGECQPTIREDGRRAPVQASLTSGVYPERTARPAGTVAWSEHEQAWEAYAARYGRHQSAERIAERHGFGYWEITDLLGREPTTWSPR